MGGGVSWLKTLSGGTGTFWFLVLLFLFQLSWGLGTGWSQEAVVVKRADRFENLMFGGQLVSKFIGHVQIEHGATGITCDEAIYFEDAGRIFLKGHVVIDDRGKLLTADRVEYWERDRKVVAYGNPLKIDRGDVVAQCGKATLIQTRNRLILERKPIIWQGYNELRGQQMILALKGPEVSRIDVVGEAVGKSTTPGYSLKGSGQLSRLNGKRITLHLKEGVTEKLVAMENAISVNILREEDGGKVRNEASGDQITLFFEGEEVGRVLIEGGAIGTYYRQEASDTTAGVDTVHYRAENIDYRVTHQTIYLQGNTRIDYHDLTLTAERITFFTEPQVLIAEGVLDTNGQSIGTPVLEERGERIEGIKLVYNLKTGRGEIWQGQTRFEKGLYTGERIRMVAERTFNLDRGVYTTCDRNEPHYHFYARRMRLYADDKVIAKPVVLYVRDVPVFALPFFVFSIKKERHSGFLIPKYGSREVDGRYLRNIGYYLAPSDYWDATLRFSFYEWTGWLLESDFRYALRYRLHGGLGGSFKKDRRFGRESKRWDLRFNHEQYLQPSMSLKVRGNFVSDESYYRDIGDSPQERMRRTLRSHLSLDKRWGDNTLRITLSQDRDLDSRITTQNLPTFSFRRPKRLIFGGKVERKKGHRRPPGRGEELKWYNLLYYSYSLDLVNYRQHFGAPDSLVVHAALDQRFNLSFPQKLFGWLGFTPSFNYQETWYDKDQEGRRYVRRSIYDGSLSVTGTFYGLFHPQVGGLRAVRHVVTPRASFSYRPDFPDRGRFYTFGGIGATPGPQQKLSLRLENLFQAKVEREDKVHKFDLAHLDFSTGYDFRREEARFDPLRSVVRLFPGPGLNVELRTTHELYDYTGRFTPLNPRLREAQVTTRLRLRGRWEVSGGAPPVEGESRGKGTEVSTSGRRPWSLSLSHHYALSRAYGVSQRTHWVRMGTAIPLTRNWRIDYSANFDLEEKQFTYQRFTFYRDLHCWEARLIWVPTGYKEGYYFRINIKAIPEIKVEKIKGVTWFGAGGGILGF